MPLIYRFSLPVLLLIAMLSPGCGMFSRSVDINYQIQETFPDNSGNVRVWTSTGSDEIEFGVTRVINNIYAMPDGKGDTIRIRFWYPAGQRIDTSRLVVLIPPYGAPDLAMFPIAAELTRRSLVTAIVSPRATGLNSALPETFGLNELDDIRLALQAYREIHSLDSLHIGLFGSSLGSVIALNLLKSEPGIEAVVLEGVMPDLDGAAREILSSESYRNAIAMLTARNQSMATYSPDQVIPGMPRVPVLAIWGSDDKLISPEDRSRLRRLLESQGGAVESAEIAGGSHTMRFGFPLAASDANALNGRIAEFLVRYLR